jgi:hypothetical protein
VVEENILSSVVVENTLESVVVEEYVPESEEAPTDDIQRASSSNVKDGRG